MSDNKKVSDYWGNFHTKERPKLSWLESQEILDYVNTRVTGCKKTSWYKSFFNSDQKYNRALIVGCGAGALERNLLKEGMFKECLGIDISPKSIDLAKDNALKQNLSNINYKVFDLERDDYIALGEFDLIIVTMAAHHIINLRYMFKNLRKILNKRNGLIIINEYIGPNRFWHSDKVLDIINQILRCLDSSYKRNYLIDGKTLRNEYIRTPLEHFLKHDPSEAVRSEDILKYFSQYFNIIEQKNYGGQINHMLLTGIIQNFKDTKEDNQILKLLMVFEELLEKYNVIQSDFSFIKAKPKKIFFW